MGACGLWLGVHIMQLEDWFTNEIYPIISFPSNKTLRDVLPYLLLTLYPVLDRLKFGLLTEIKSCNNRIGQSLRKKYRREMDYVYALINEMERKLERPIRDLDDVRLVMDMLKKIREQEIDMELKIEPIEVSREDEF